MKNGLKILFAFICGIISVIMIIPILESLTELFCQFLETLKIKTTKKIVVGNAEIEELQAKNEQYCSQAIGFEIPSQSYEDEDEWEDDDCCKNKVKNKIGF